MFRRWLGRRSRWAVPAAVAALIGAVLVGSVVASAAAAPALPRRTPAQLLAGIERAQIPAAFTATITESANLGIPDLPGEGGASSPLSLLAGSHVINLWYAGPAHVRIELPVSFGETDLRVSGSQAWLWNSRSQTATHLIRARPAGPLPPEMPGVSAPPPPGWQLTPLQAARRLLAAVGPTTAVTVRGTTSVAGRTAYQLVIAPRSPQSLIGQVRIAVDGALMLPLQVQVYPRGSSSPAFAVGFTALSLGRPAAANFAFTPPPGATVRTTRLPGALGAGWAGVHPGLGPGLAGPGAWRAAAPARRVPLRALPRAMLRCVRHGGTAWIVRPRPERLAPGARPVSRPACFGFLPRPAAQRCSRNSRFHFVRHRPRLVPLPVRLGCVRFPMGPPAGWPSPPGGGVRVLGSGWLTVVALPGPASGVSSCALTVMPPGSSSTAYSSTVRITASASQLGLPPGLQRIASRVHGSWGSGRLLRLPLLSVLITSKGQVLAGAVTPAVLYADAGKVR